MEWKGLYALSRVKFSQIFKIMRVFTICMLVFVFGATASGFSQKQVVTLDLRQCDMSTLFQEIWKQTGLRFVYNDKDVASISRFDVKAKSETVEKVLEEVFAKTSLKCSFEGDVGGRYGQEGDCEGEGDGREQDAFAGGDGCGEDSRCRIEFDRYGN